MIGTLSATSGTSHGDPLAESVIKPAAAAIKPRRFGAKPWRAHEDSATGPEHVSHTRGGGGVALSAATAPTRFSTPITAMLTETIHAFGDFRVCFRRVRPVQHQKTRTPTLLPARHVLYFKLGKRLTEPLNIPHRVDSKQAHRPNQHA